jgi:glycosyltransferase involved in cell wall biosynthesis
MRVVHLEAGRHLYGGARQVAHLIAGLEQLDVENVLLCARGSAIARAALPAESIELPLNGELDVGQLGRLSKVLQTLGADLLHVHSRRGADLYGGFAARRAGMPAVLTRRVDSREPAVWMRAKWRPYARIIAISNHIRTDLIERAGFASARVPLVASAVDADRFAPRPDSGRLAQAFGVPRDALVLGCVAQLIPRKGHRVLLQAFKQLARDDARLQLICFGTGPLRATLERQIAALELGRRVVLAGYREDLPELLGELAVLVHPAEREGLGVAVLEAMSAGVPVVAARAGGVPDSIAHEDTGLLVAPGDAAALATAIQRLLADAALRARLVEHGRHKIETDFSIARMAGGNLRVYQEVLGSRGADG